MHVPHLTRLTDWDKWWQIQGHCGDHYYCCSCRNWQSNICSNIKSKKVGDTISWFKAPPSYSASCMVMCIKILNCLCFQETLFSITASKHSYQVSNYNLQHTYRANVVTDYLPLSKDVLAVYPISGILRFHKCHVLQNSANAHRVPEWSYFDLIEKRISNWSVILKIAPHVHRQCPGVSGGLSVSGLLRSLR